MAMSESTPAPPYGAVANKDNTHQGECESDDNQGNEEGCEIDPADLEDGEILDDSEGEGSENKTGPTTMVNLENIILNNPAGDSDYETKKPKKKRSKHQGNANEEPLKKRKKFLDHGRSGDSDDRSCSPISRSRSQKRHGDGMGASRRQEKGTFEEDIAIEERRHLKQGSKGSIHQRLGEWSGGRQKSRSSTSSKLGLHRKRGLMGRPPIRKREPRPKPICKFFLEGNCNKGEICTFSHDTTPLRKKDLCKFYLQGYCNKEDACLFMHNDFPCKFYHTGAVCYADTECRFSHKPLTDEAKMLLDRYLESSHCSSKGDRRRDLSPPPIRMDRGRPPPHSHSPHHQNNKSNNSMNECNMKMRPSLLGSPPRHIKEAASEWQQDLMMQMHQHNEKSPPNMTRPNFYMDTLEESPQRGIVHGMNEPEPFQMGGPFAQTPNCGDVTPNQGGATPIPTDDEAEGDSEDRMNFPQHTQVRFLMKQHVHHQQQQPQMARLLPETEENISAAISAIRAESDCQRTPPHLEMERSLSPTSRPDINDQPPNLLAGSPPSASQLKIKIKEEPKDDSEDTAAETSESDQLPALSEDTPMPVFPSHLPRKQRELFMRIQQHQRLAKLKLITEGDSSTDDTEEIPEEKQIKLEPPDLPKEEVPKPEKVEKTDIKEEPVKEEEKSPEEEDDDEDEEPDEKPRPKWYSSDEDDDNNDQPLTDVLKRLQQMPPAPPVPTAAPPIDIAKMLSSIREQTTQQSALSSGLKSDFWQNILSATAPPPNIVASSEPEPTQPPVKRDPRSRAPALPLPSKLLPQPTAPLSVDKPINRTPLNARDPRLLSRTMPKPEPESVIPTLKPKPVEVMPIKEEKFWEPAPRDKDKKTGLPTYKLHTITVLPLNYSSYLFATQNDTKLLDDPRLKKLLNSQTPPRPMATLPFPPELQQLLEQGDTKPKQSPPSVPPQPVPAPAPLPTTNLILGAGSSTTQKSDPRLKRNPPPTAQSPVHSGGFTPPHPTNPLMDMPPNLFPSGGFTPPTPPPIGHQMMDMPNPLMMGYFPPRHMNPMMDMGPPGLLHTPMLHTHMPRGFTDPRFARLQQPMNHRRGRGNLRHQGPSRKLPKDVINKTAPGLPETKPSEPQKNETDDKSQRKKQMDYSSPLSSYDEGTTSEGSAYNRRPQPRTNPPAPSTPPVSTTPPPQLAPMPPVSVPQLNIPSSNQPNTATENTDLPVEDANAASLRDVFKTIDPTASPFC